MTESAVTVEEHAESLRIVLCGEIDFEVAEQVSDDDLLHAIVDGKAVVDGSRVTFFDSSGLAILLRLHNFGASVGIVAPSPAMQRVIDITGLGRVFATVTV